MAIITTMRRGRSQARAISLRSDDRFFSAEMQPQRDSSLGFLVGTAIVAGTVLGLLAYDGHRPIAAGASAVATTAPLVISVKPSR